MEAYCVKCRQKVDMVDVTEVVVDTKRGKKRIAKGTCPQCHGKVARIMGKA